VNYQSLARRYLPLAAVIAVQLLIIAVVPSKASNSNQVATGGGAASQGYSNGGSAGGTGTGASGSGAGGSGTGVGTGSGGGAALTGVSATGTGAGGGGGGGGGGGVSGGSSGGGGSPGAGGGGGGVGGDTTHCSGGREFSPSIDFYAPPCTPGSIGAADAGNGGSTWEGVTGNTITLVDYISNYGAEVNAIEQAEGLYESYANGQVLDAAWQNFINAHYVLWGRKIKIITYQGQCTSVPPDYSCLEAEMNTIVATYHPYGVMWNTTLCSACYETLAADHVVAFGGVGFSDQFIDANAPYIYSAGESSSRIEQMFAQWYCNQLNPYPVQFAPDKNPAQNFNGQKRVLGVISTNDADNEATVQNVLVPALKADCGVSVNHFYFYAQNINTAAQQVEAGISAMDTTSNPATDVLCLCDPVAPEFLYEGEQQHNYWPENLLADTQGMTDDSAAQNYGPSSTVACPLGNPCEFEDAFGLSFNGTEEPENNNDATRVFKAGGGGTLPVTGAVAEALWEDWNEMASLIENTGPTLTPARMQAAAPSMGTIGGGSSGHYEVGFGQGDYSWIQDAEVVYWDQNRTSPYNGAKGTFVTLEGTRYLPGQFPRGQLSIPGGNNPANRPS
jgi:hypothetical protein